MRKKFIVVVEWDDDAGMWVATSDDIPGLVTEARSLDHLVERILAVASELLDDNAHLLGKEKFAGDLIDMCIMSKLPRDGYHAH